ncbi:zf-HC2 domain-containing protein [Marinobacterium mangrovicola]|uniref:Putative zinc finger protein n=1 Tax=Marinobacterium mangrovicola TaxID=1476959 RepID=A0A4R1GBI4_9GAMM|nr:zf-HC2 domain-containing protein [Marinobacterium mangrovicola]TCK04133.1 putative zinc finger protein [Marinobacterium mangrovicola]
MTMACKRATELMSIKIDRPLTLGERVSLRTHLMMCSYCRRCEQQLQMLRRITGRRREDESSDKEGE